jgi:hypothetical protein
MVELNKNIMWNVYRSWHMIKMWAMSSLKDKLIQKYKNLVSKKGKDISNMQGRYITYRAPR